MTLDQYTRELAELKSEERLIKTQRHDRPLDQDEAEERIYEIRNRRRELAVAYWGQFS